MKYGSTGRLRARIFGNYLGGIGGATTQRIHEELFSNGMIGRVEIAWFEAENEEEALTRERQCRQAYMKEHGGRRPIWDLQA